MPVTNLENVQSDNPTEKYLTSIGTPVNSSQNATFGAKAGTLFGNETNPTEVQLSGTGAPIKNK